MKKLILSILFILCLSFQASAWVPTAVLSGTSGRSVSTPTYVTYASDFGSWGTTFTLSITTVAGSNRCFVFFLDSDNDAHTVNSVKFDSNPMTLVASKSGLGSHKVYMYRYCTTDAFSGSKDFEIIFSGEQQQHGWGVQIDGCNTTDPIEDTDTGETSADPQEITLHASTATNNCLLITGVVTQEDGINHTVCDSTGQTEFIDVSHTLNSIVGSWFDLATAGEKDQCIAGVTAAKRQFGILGAFKPYGS